MTDHSPPDSTPTRVWEARQERFEERLAELDICQILADVRHPQTNCKLERLPGELKRKLDHSGTVVGGSTGGTMFAPTGS